MKLIMPEHFRVYEREATRWFAHDPTKVVFNATDQPIILQKVEQAFGLTEEQLTIALFRINGGRAGYYLADLKTKQYYYCGGSLEGVRAKLLELGIGRADPMESE